MYVFCSLYIIFVVGYYARDYVYSILYLLYKNGRFDLNIARNTFLPLLLLRKHTRAVVDSEPWAVRLFTYMYIYVLMLRYITNVRVSHIC